MKQRNAQLPSRFFSWNVNGIRAAQKNGFLKWFESAKPDFLCLQEIKATPEQLEETLVHPMGYHSFWNPAKKPGYSGTAIYTKEEPLEIKVGLGKSLFDDEGRVISAYFKDFVLVNAYFPNSQRERARLSYKLDFCQEMLKFCNGLKASGKNVILCGDYNIAHQAIDLKNPKSNENNAGYLPEEREWMSQFLKAGYLDGFRHFNNRPDHYTWWSYRPGVRDKNIGWRIDYFCTNLEHKDRLVEVTHHPQVRGSDHCPVELVLRG